MKEHEIKIAEFEKKFSATRNLSKKFNLYWENKRFLESYAPINNLGYIEKMLHTAIKKEDKHVEHLLYIFQGYLYKNNGEYDKALQLYYKSKKYFYTSENKSYYAKILSDIAVIFATLGLYNQACYIWKDLLRSYIEKDNFYQYSLVLNNLIYTSMISFQNYDQIEEVLNEILEKMKNEANLSDFILCKTKANLGQFYLSKFQDYKRALIFFNEALEITDNIHEKMAKFEILIKIAECYKGLKDEVNRISYLIKALKSIENTEINVNCLPLYKELYQYYKSKEDMKRALKYFEVIHKLELSKKEQENNVNAILEKIGMVSDDKSHINFLNEYSKKHIFDFKRDIFLENIKGVLVKINLDAIVSVASYSKIVKIYFVDKSQHIYKISLKEFLDLICEKFGDDHLFFSTNLRSEIVNLFWMNNFDKLNKKLYFNVLGEELEYEVTRSQAVLLRDFIKLK